MDVKSKIYWCDSCKTPCSINEIILPKVCSLCGKEVNYLCSDIRPVFPEERLLFELIIGKPLEFAEKSVWCNYVSFSGGKDSTVISDLVTKSTSNPSIPHIYCDTTLEYPHTLEYVKKLKETNILYDFKNSQK